MSEVDPENQDLKERSSPRIDNETICEVLSVARAIDSDYEKNSGMDQVPVTRLIRKIRIERTRHREVIELIYAG